MTADAGRLAAFVAGLPDGKRHQGFYWAAMVAAENGLPPSQVKLITAAATGNGLDEAYVKRTMAEVHEAVQRA